MDTETPGPRRPSFTYQFEEPMVSKDGKTLILKASVWIHNPDEEVQRILDEVHRLDLQDAVDKFMAGLNRQEEG